MNCKEVKEIILENINSELNDQNVLEHINSCKSCQEFANYEDTLKECFYALAHIKPPTEVEESILEIPQKYSHYNSLYKYVNNFYTYITATYQRVAITGALIGFVLALIFNPFSWFLDEYKTQESNNNFMQIGQRQTKKIENKNKNLIDKKIEIKDQNNNSNLSDTEINNNMMLLSKTFEGQNNQKIPYGLIPPTPNFNDKHLQNISKDLSPINKLSRIDSDKIKAKEELQENKEINIEVIETKKAIESKGKKYNYEKPSVTASVALNDEDVPIVRGKPLFELEESSSYESVDGKALINTNTNKINLTLQHLPKSSEAALENITNSNQQAKKFSSAQELVEYVANNYANSISEGWLDINEWVIKKWITVKERIFIAPPQGYRWYLEKINGKFKVSLRKYNVQENE